MSADRPTTKAETPAHLAIDYFNGLKSGASGDLGFYLAVLADDFGTDDTTRECFVETLHEKLVELAQGVSTRAAGATRDEVDFDDVCTPMRKRMWRAHALCEVVGEYVREQAFGENAIGMNIRLTVETVSALLDDALGQSNQLADHYVVLKKRRAS